MRHYLCISHGAFHNRSYVMKKISSGCTGHFRLIIHGIYGLKVIKKLFLTFPSVFEKSFIKKSSKNNTTKENLTFVCTTQRKLTVKFSQEDVCFQGNSNLPST